ncbi:translation initiation factor, aIF-2BI family [Desulfurispirillum indicum S5]|uniref:Methylthioribose-1-phosphate isomerase n=1 Tax=Desulfurispirillum indicum (strain ATCC BAA-1389 / DSM 22839 / S5) TaxID=653733 RepID=E6W5H4_DESIS|nr:S-methyl-5-thioribose-1-phosphate isomerase [Desulfurispirillum indicum]ADU64905.1 translation initiation factor, aIF-2BI family [Desulfurispirillum indicum S5]
MTETLRFDSSSSELHLLDQRILPHQTAYIRCRTHGEVADAITTMVVRGAPAIGVAAAYGVYLGALEALKNQESISHTMEQVFALLAASRPTAVNLFWAIEKMRRVSERHMTADPQIWRQALLEEALRIHADDVESNRRMGAYGAPLLPAGGGVLTHCNAGALATAGYGTALGVIRSAVSAGRGIQVYATETRPFLQGARLTAFELLQDNIPVTLLCDNMVGSLMAQGKIQAVVVGADRIAANGDTANKIGTYTIAIVAKEHGIPVYIAAPCSTIDLQIASGDQIVIEQRDPAEVTHLQGHHIAAAGVQVENPSFDVTPARFISAIITDKGVAYPPYRETLAQLVGSD